MEGKLVEYTVLILGVCVVLTTCTFEDPTTNEERCLPSNPSTLYKVNPVSVITINTGCNETEDDVQLKEQLTAITSLLTGLISKLESGELCCDQKTQFSDCYDIQQNGETESGVYTIRPAGSHPFEVYCDMETDGGGWTVFQRRQDGSIDFYRDWQDYKNGFGLVDGEHWLGNENIYYLSNQKEYGLRIDLEDFENASRYATYYSFSIADESDKYRLDLGAYTGDAGDAMTFSSNQQFSTKDADYDSHGTSNCAAVYKGAWWYNNCHEANLNGPYLGGEHETFADGIEWKQWTGYNYSLRFSEMKLRPHV